MILNNIKSEVFKIFKTVCQSRSDIENITVCEYMPFKDKYGNEADNIVFSAYLKKNTIQQLNWDNLCFSDLERFCDSYFVHVALKN